MRLVIDSNVWISALVFGGMPRRILDSAAHSGDTIALSPEISTEVHRTLASKFPGLEADFDAYTLLISHRILRVRLGAVTVDACRDPDDNRVLETALLSEASAIITGDKDLLVLDPFHDVRILTPAQWLAQGSGC